MNKKLAEELLSSKWNWAWVEHLISKHADRIIKKGPGDDYSQFRDQDEKEFLLQRIQDFIEAMISQHLFMDYGMVQLFYHKYKALLENQIDFRNLLLLMQFGAAKDIDNKILAFLSLAKKKPGRQQTFYKGRLTVILVELFYHAGYKRNHCFKKVALLFDLMNDLPSDTKMSEEQNRVLRKFLKTLPSNQHTVRGLYKRYRKTVDLLNFPDPDRTRIYFAPIILKTSKES